LIFSDVFCILHPSLHRSNAEDPALDLEAHLLLDSICSPFSSAGHNLSHCIVEAIEPPLWTLLKCPPATPWLGVLTFRLTVLCLNAIWALRFRSFYDTSCWEAQMTLDPYAVTRRMLRTALSLCVFLIPSGSVAQPEIIAKFLSRAHTFQDATLVYRLFVPEGYTPSKRYAIVLALHGNGAQGSDNLIHIQGSRLATSWADPINQTKYPCFVVAPQCRAGHFWVEEEALSSDLASANNILDSLAREFTIDTTRMYVTGLSMGGYATWHLATLFPERFAAAIPVSSGWWVSTAPLIGLVPIWAFIGVQDALVPVESVREMIDAFRHLGRSVVYTHCNNGNDAALPDSVIAAYVRSRADLFYTEAPGAGHDGGFFDYAYDFPYLRPWLFDKIRLTRGSVTLNNLKSFRTLRGMETITWATSTPSDSVEIRFSPDAGSTWQTVVSAFPNTGSYLWNTQEVTDCAFGLLRIVVKNPAGQAHGYDQSGYFAIDNGAQGKPHAKILNPFRFWWELIDSSTVTLKYLCGSSKRVPLSVSFWYSPDDGVNFAQFDGHTAQGDTSGRTRTLDIAALPNSENAVLRIDVSDGTKLSSDTTSPKYFFAKRTPRISGPIPSRISGVGDGRVTVHVVDASKLTGDQYRLTFNTTPSRGKTYDVQNESKGIRVVQNATEMDGAREGPLFDGMRLIVCDYARAEPNTDSSRWESGVPTLLNVQIGVLNLNIDGQPINGYPYPADYRISFFDHVVDTSSESIFGTGRIPVNFRVWNATENRKSDFVFIDSDNNRQITSLDEIYILEPDSQGGLQLTWDLFFVGVPPETSVPGPGDQFVFRTHKPFQPGDTFTFKGIVASVGTGSLSEIPMLFQNFPNPFNPSTTIRYGLPYRSHVTLTIFSILGQQVAQLVNGEQEAGYHEVKFDGSKLASGVYLYRIQAGNFVETRKLLLVR